MSEQRENYAKNLVGGEYLSQIDQFRAASNASITINSGSTILTSATQDVAAVGASNLVRLAMLNVHLVNGERTQWMAVEFRDGSFTGRRLIGPLYVPAAGERMVGYDQLAGRFAYSSIAAVIVSAGVASGQPPVSNGVVANVGFLAERLDLYE